MKLKILNLNEFEEIIINNIKDINYNIFFIDNNNRN